MATSLNGLSFGDTIDEGLMESPARSENLFYLRFVYFNFINICQVIRYAVSFTLAWIFTKL